jgi:hypothetical protein
MNKPKTIGNTIKYQLNWNSQTSIEEAENTNNNSRLRL